MLWNPLDTRLTKLHEQAPVGPRVAPVFADVIREVDTHDAVGLDVAELLDILVFSG